MTKQPIPWVTAGLCLLCTLVFLLVPFEWGALIPYEVTHHPLSWVTIRGLIFSSFIHADLSHLSGNLFIIAFLGYALERIVGSINMLKLVFASMLGAFCLYVGFDINSTTGAGGASGIVFGIVGAYALVA